MSKASDDFKDIYNRNFFKENKPVKVRIKMEITINNETAIKLDPVSVTADTKIGQLMTSYHNFLKENPDMELNFVNGGKVTVFPSASAETVEGDSKIVEYKKNEYRIDSLKENPIITNIKSGKEISVKSPMGKAILKKIV